MVQDIEDLTKEKDEKLATTTEAEKNRCVGVGASKKAKLEPKCRKLKKRETRRPRNMQKGKEMVKAKLVHAASEGYMKNISLRQRLQN